MVSFTLRQYVTTAILVRTSALQNPAEAVSEKRQQSLYDELMASYENQGMGH